MLNISWCLQCVIICAAGVQVKHQRASILRHAGCEEEETDGQWQVKSQCHTCHGRVSTAGSHCVSHRISSISALTIVVECTRFQSGGSGSSLAWMCGTDCKWLTLLCILIIGTCNMVTYKRHLLLWFTRLSSCFYCPTSAHYAPHVCALFF